MIFTWQPLILIIRTETGDLTAGIPRTLNYRASVPDGGHLENILPHVQPQRSAQLWQLRVTHSPWSGLRRLTAKFFQSDRFFAIRACMVINPGELAATLSWFRPTGCPRLDIHDPAMHRLWHFRTSISQEQEDRRSSWALGFRVPPSLSVNAVTLHCLNLEIPITLGNILASSRRFKGGFVRVAHERGPTMYAKVQRRPGSSIMQSFLASAWPCQMQKV